MNITYNYGDRTNSNRQWPIVWHEVTEYSVPMDRKALSDSTDDLINKISTRNQEGYVDMNLSTQVRKAIEQVAEKTGKSYSEVGEYLLRKALGIESLSVEEAVAALKENPKG